MGRTLAELAAAPLTYREVGATRDGALPAGYGHVRRDVVIGHGVEAFARAADGLLGWRMHRAAGLDCRASAPRAATGVVVLLRTGPRPLLLNVPCRVVHTVEEPTRRGFAYGTLPGHPERGEEAFEVVLAEDGEVRFRIRAFSRPATLLARACGPLTRLAQRYVTNRYVRAMRTIASG
ncbi:hypothetical protein Val02_30260 [Virgisporangium aliadipatigenens]|uniref:DUF1990 domain-containing protein n=1 Tax=Virgisporangium aliadipatigenens TaxID=741659 RepID=A0A8J3YLL2_9ACTN|nr:DUF1990 domain-containing protein [Virgisporangium aliadipatigenens]GIJ46140.1 hypothetical protein Val02_30260 [Virgisporangium aliadipatigenens]